MLKNILLILATWSCFVTATNGQNAQITINQGSIIGLKIFPESSKVAILSFLGVPYAEPPTNSRRFVLPKPHGGWNQTYYARELKPICSQPRNSIYDETTDRQSGRTIQMSEDCLYLNIWTPETGLRHGDLPVLAIITGEEMTFDWSHNRPTGLDLASEGIVVVTIQYRTNIFGWLHGNFGLHDQRLALEWIQQNIHKFGGKASQVTLLGHGTTGAVCSLIHLERAKSVQKLFSKIVLMSGVLLKLQNNANLFFTDYSNEITDKLKCDGDHTMNCLREKSTRDLEEAFKSVYRRYNFSAILGPKPSSFLNETENTINLSQTISNQNIPIMIGITSGEGYFMRDYWIDLARDGYENLMRYINESVIPELLGKHQLYPLSGRSEIVDTVYWRYFSAFPKTSSYLLNSMQRLITELDFENQFYELLEEISHQRSEQSNSSSIEGAPIYAYSFQFDNSMDMRGKVNVFGGASHSSDLPLIMGPSLFQQIARRRFKSSEDKFCKKLRQIFTDFVKTGNPTPGRIYDAWLPFTKVENNFIKILSISSSTKPSALGRFETNIPLIEDLIENSNDPVVTVSSQLTPLNPYQRNARVDSSRKDTESYLKNHQDYEYFTHLKRVNSFWNVLIAGIVRHAETLDKENTISLRNGREISYLENDSAKYKNAFISMLALVCLLLTVLGICVYIIKKSNNNFGHSL